VQPRNQPLQRTPYSASDLRRLFAGVKGPNGVTKPTARSAGGGGGSLAYRAASSIERIIARIIRTPLSPAAGSPGSNGSSRRSGSSGSSPSSGTSPKRGAAGSCLAEAGSSPIGSWQLAATSEHELKRLGFVLVYADYYFNWGLGLAASVYSTGRSLLVPSPLVGVAGSLESTVSSISRPVFHAVQDQSGKVLKGLDARVDGMINAASGLYASNAVALQAAVEGSEKGLAAAAAAKDAYLQRIESALGLLKEKGMGGAASVAADKVVATVGSVKALPPYLESEVKALMLKVGDAWAGLAEMPVVGRALQTVQPSIDFAWNKYLEAHDALVSAPSYNKAVDLGAEQLSRVQDTAVWRSVQPALDPAIDAISHSAPYAALVDHLRPQLAASTAAVAP
jgi:hypothetical protein